MNLREQIKEIAAKRINPAFADYAGFTGCVAQLAQRAFVHKWADGTETRAIRKAWLMLNEKPGYVDEQVPAEE